MAAKKRIFVVWGADNPRIYVNPPAGIEGAIEYDAAALPKGVAPHFWKPTKDGKIVGMNPIEKAAKSAKMGVAAQAHKVLLRKNRKHIIIGAAMLLIGVMTGALIWR
jgi:hypothetical protein